MKKFKNLPKRGTKPSEDDNYGCDDDARKPMSAGATLGLFLRSTGSKEKDTTSTNIKGMLMVQKVSVIYF